MGISIYSFLVSLKEAGCRLDVVETEDGTSYSIFQIVNCDTLFTANTIEKCRNWFFGTEDET